MADRETIKTSIKEIVDYWDKHVYEGDLSIDFSEANERCWRCGCKRNLQRCHIIPHSLGGKDEPSNLVLLCKRCHLDNPNVADEEIMWDWLRAYAVTFYDTFWDLQGMQEYKKIYSKSISDEFRERKITKEQIEEIKNIILKQIKKATYHFGDPHLNVATLAGLYRMALKEYDKIHGIETPREVKPYISISDYFS